MLGFLSNLFDYSSDPAEAERQAQLEELKRQQQEYLRNEQIRQQKEKQKAQSQQEQEQKKKEQQVQKQPQQSPLAFGQHPASQGAGGITNAQPIPNATLLPSAVSRGDGNPVQSTALPQFGRTQPSNNVRVAPQMNLSPPPPPIPKPPGPLEQIMSALSGNQNGQQNPFDVLLGRSQNNFGNVGVLRSMPSDVTIGPPSFAPLNPNKVQPGEFMPQPSGPTHYQIIPNNMNERMSMLQQGAAQAYPNNPLMQQVAMSQAILESGLQGKGSSLARKYNNLFGIKGKGTAGSVNMPTKEFYNGQMQSVNDGFARNANIADSFAQHRNLMNKPRYKSVLGAQDPMAAFRALKQSGYATDPNYSNKLYNIYNQFVKPRY